MIVLGHAHQSQTGERRRGLTRHHVDVLGTLVAVVFATELDGTPRSLSIAQSSAWIATTIDALAANLVFARRTAKIARGNLLQFAPCVHGACVVGACHGMSRLAPHRRARPRQVLSGVAPDDFRFLP